MCPTSRLAATVHAHRRRRGRRAKDLLHGWGVLSRRDHLREQIGRKRSLGAACRRRRAGACARRSDDSANRDRSRSAVFWSERRHARNRPEGRRFHYPDGVTLLTVTPGQSDHVRVDTDDPLSIEPRRDQPGGAQRPACPRGSRRGGCLPIMTIGPSSSPMRSCETRSSSSGTAAPPPSPQGQSQVI